MSDLPQCPTCHRALDRVDHYGIEHLTLADDVYRPVAINDGDADGSGFGVASETDIRCGYCSMPLPRVLREFFYRRWYQVIEVTGSQRET